MTEIEDVHHIVPSTHRGAERARELFDDYGIDINSADNGVVLTRGQHQGHGLHTELLPLAYDGSGHFQVVNMLDIVDCLDEDRSTIDRYTDGDIASVKKYVFKPGSTDGHHLFKCRQWGLHNLVSAEFKALVEEKGLIGAYFTPVGE